MKHLWVSNRLLTDAYERGCSNERGGQYLMIFLNYYFIILDTDISVTLLMVPILNLISEVLPNISTFKVSLSGRQDSPDLCGQPAKSRLILVGGCANRQLLLEFFDKLLFNESRAFHPRRLK